MRADDANEDDGDDREEEVMLITRREDDCELMKTEGRARRAGDEDGDGNAGSDIESTDTLGTVEFMSRQ